MDEGGIVHHGKFGLSMSALGQKQTLEGILLMSALPPKADIGRACRDDLTLATGMALTTAFAFSLSGASVLARCGVGNQIAILFDGGGVTPESFEETIADGYVGNCH